MIRRQDASGIRHRGAPRAGRSGRAAAVLPVPSPSGRVLELSLEPRSCGDFDLQRELGEEVWTSLERAVMSAKGAGCDICGGAPAAVEACWRYIDSRGVRSLEGFELLCHLCSQARNLVRAGDTLPDEEFRKVIRHLERLNGYSPIELMQALDQAFAEFHRRSQIQWRSDLGLLTFFRGGQS